MRCSPIVPAAQRRRDARRRLQFCRLFARDEERIRIQQRRRAQVPLRNEPDLPLRVREHEVALARFRRVVDAQHFVEQARIELSFVDRVRVGNLPGFQWDDLDEQSVSEVHAAQDSLDLPGAGTRI